MATYAILNEDEFIISLSEPATVLVQDINRKISLCMRNPHDDREDKLAFVILSKLLTQCINEHPGDKGESREESRLQRGDR